MEEEKKHEGRSWSFIVAMVLCIVLGVYFMVSVCADLARMSNGTKESWFSLFEYIGLTIAVFMAPIGLGIGIGELSSGKPAKSNIKTGLVINSGERYVQR